MLSSEFNNYQQLFDDQSIEIEPIIICKEIFSADAKSGYLDIIKKMEAKLTRNQL